MTEVYSFIRFEDKKSIYIRFIDLPSKTTNADELLHNMFHFLDYACARELTPGLYITGYQTNFKLTAENIEMILSNSHKARIAKLEKALEDNKKEKQKIVCEIRDQKNMYFIERKSRGIPIEREKLRDEIKALEKALENKKKELNNW